VANLRRYGLDMLLAERVASGTPLLGICLGMQLLFDSSTERGELTHGLGLIAGQVRALDAGQLRIPHIGWNEVRLERPSRLTSELPDAGAPFYHVHSYVATPAHVGDVVGTAEYGERFATIVENGCVYGTQFHPEKSSRDGLTLLTSFVGLVRDAEPTGLHA
jgi:glutamine amidotransferase